MQFIPFILFCISTSLTPGPNNLMIMNSGLEFGVVRSLMHYFGICIGFALMVFLVSMGIGHIFLQISWLKHAMSLGGSIYMLYLAFQLYTSKSEGKTSFQKKPWSFFKALGFQWLNPKAWLMAISAIMIFSISKDPLLNAFFMSGIFFLICLPCIGVWLLFGHFLKRVLTSARHRRLFNHAMATGLVFSVVLIWV